ncbi:52 kDa repressor of the inhibitor of the protein kinase-like [Apostichopus japonicus]|uniref:52 kDa repressor of the inhibitor of the protein kinase-like n=1 Tax=Stichopus japonicus TaxID=307972 RepID=UPI003AB7806A
MCLVILKNVLHPLRAITTKLQKRDMDIRSAYTSLTEVSNDIVAIRRDIDARFALWYQDALDLAKELDVEEARPRAKGRNAYRATHPAETPKDYFKRAIAIPFVDDVCSQMKERFATDSNGAILALFTLIPSVMINMEVSELPKVVEGLVMYRDDFPRFKSLRTELEVWHSKCKNMQNPPDSLLLALHTCNKDLFPNLVVLLQIASVIPVTSCKAERSFSAVRRHKTVLRSTMGEERLTALVLMNTYYNTPIDTDEVVRKFIEKHPRLFRRTSQLLRWQCKIKTSGVDIVSLGK